MRRPTDGSATSVEKPAMTELQDALTSTGSGAFRRYRELVVGSTRWSDLLAYELAATFLLPLPGALGYFLRQKLLRYLLGSCGRGVLVGRGLTVRHPRAVHLGERVLLDDFVTLDAKGSKSRIEIGDRAMIGRSTILSTTDGEIVIGPGSNIGSGCRIASRARLRLGRSVLVAANCYLGASNHRFDRLDVPVIAQGLEALEPIEIEDNVWIGTAATVMYGVRVGHDAIIGAHALVNQDVPPLAIVAGIPARVLRFRDGRLPPRTAETPV